MTPGRAGSKFVVLAAAEDNVTTAELEAIPLFESLSEDDRREIASWLSARTVGEGVQLIGEGASGYCFFILTEGDAVVTAGGKGLASLGPGDFFGEVAILDGGRRTATVTTSSPARVLVMFGTEFRKLEQTHPGVAARIDATMRQRVENRN